MFAFGAKRLVHKRLVAVLGTAALAISAPHASEPRVGAEVARPESGADLGFSFVNVAREAGLNHTTVFGGSTANKYLLETTGTGVAFIDYDNDGWLDLFF